MQTAVDTKPWSFVGLHVDGDPDLTKFKNDTYIIDTPLTITALLLSLSNKISALQTFEDCANPHITVERFLNGHWSGYTRLLTDEDVLRYVLTFTEHRALWSLLDVDLTNRLDIVLQCSGQLRFNVICEPRPDQLAPAPNQ